MGGSVSKPHKRQRSEQKTYRAPLAGAGRAPGEPLGVGAAPPSALPGPRPPGLIGLVEVRPEAEKPETPPSWSTAAPGTPRNGHARPARGRRGETPVAGRPGGGRARNPKAPGDRWQPEPAGALGPLGAALRWETTVKTPQTAGSCPLACRPSGPGGNDPEGGQLSRSGGCFSSSISRRCRKYLWLCLSQDQPLTRCRLGGAGSAGLHPARGRC